MLRNLLLITSGGVVLFSKEFFNPVAQPRMVGSLLVAMVEFSQQTMGLQLSYLELSTLGVTLVGSESAKIFCMLLHDKSAGESFGKLLATEILLSFLEDYPADSLAVGRNLQGSYNGFFLKLSSVIRKSVIPVLQALQTERGVAQAVLVTDEGEWFGDSMSSGTSDVDQLGLLSNVQALISNAQSIMAHHHDELEELWIEAAPSRASRVVVQRLEGATFVVVCSRRYSTATYEPVIRRAKDLMRKVLALGNMMNKALT